MRTPEISPVHHSGWTGCSRNARTIHHTPTTRNRKPSVSASAANVPAGSTKQIPAETANSTPNSADTQRVMPGTAVSANVWTDARTNISPTTTPTVLTEAASNCSTTSEITTQAMPATSDSHQWPVAWRTAS